MRNKILSLVFVIMLSYNVNADYKSTVQVNKPHKLNYADLHKIIPNINKIKPKVIFPLYINPNNINSSNII